VDTEGRTGHANTSTPTLTSTPPKSSTIQQTVTAANGLGTTERKSTLSPTNHSPASNNNSTYPLLGWWLNASTTTLPQPINIVQSELNKVKTIKNLLKNTLYTFTDILDNCSLQFHFNSNKFNIKKPPMTLLISFQESMKQCRTIHLLIQLLTVTVALFNLIVMTVIIIIIPLPMILQ